jgi:hypothetical protein
MKALLILLLGIIFGAGGMLFLPELTSRREQLNEETKKHLGILEGQIRDLGDQLKKINPPKQSLMRLATGWRSSLTGAKNTNCWQT